MPEGPLFDYRQRVADGALKPDPAQELLAEKLQSLHRALAGYTPSAGAAARATPPPPPIDCPTMAWALWPLVFT